jgi:hypothetical protein
MATRARARSTRFVARACGRAMGASGASARANIACRSDEVTSVVGGSEVKF